MNKQRPAGLISAFVLLMLLNVFNFSTLLIYPPNSQRIPAIIYYESIVLWVVGLVAAYGLWTLKPWGWWLTVILSVVAFATVAPWAVLYHHIGAGGGTGGKLTAVVVCIFFAAVVALLALPSSRKVVLA